MSDSICDMELIHDKIKGFVDFAYRIYTSQYPYQENVLRRYSFEIYDNWFRSDFIPELTRCYDIADMFSVEEFFENNESIHKAVESLFEYFDNYTLDDSNDNKVNIM